MTPLLCRRQTVGETFGHGANHPRTRNDQVRIRYVRLGVSRCHVVPPGTFVYGTVNMKNTHRQVHTSTYAEENVDDRCTSKYLEKNK